MRNLNRRYVSVVPMLLLGAGEQKSSQSSMKEADSCAFADYSNATRHDFEKSSALPHRMKLTVWHTYMQTSCARSCAILSRVLVSAEFLVVASPKRQASLTHPSWYEMGAARNTTYPRGTTTAATAPDQPIPRRFHPVETLGQDQRTSKGHTSPRQQ